MSDESLTKRKKTYGIILVLITYLLIESVALYCLHYLRKTQDIRYTPVNTLSDKNRAALDDLLKGKMNYTVFSAELGWTIKENGSKKHYQANSRGIRSSREYSIEPPSNILRIACFGDSFTHGDDVRNEKTWETSLENISTNTEVINFGVPGYGPDQAFLRYQKEGVLYEPHVVFIGFMVENIFRNINTFRPFYYPKTGLPLFKPRFVLENNNLKKLPNPFIQLQDYEQLLAQPQKVFAQVGPNDFFYQNGYKSSFMDFSPLARLIKMAGYKIRKKNEFGILKNGRYNEDSDAFKITAAILDEFYGTVLKNGSRPVILIFPRFGDVEVYRTHGDKMYAPLLTHLEDKGYSHIDLMDAFNETDIPTDTWFVRRSHYSPEGNQRVAEELRVYLDQRELHRPTDNSR